jgi:hypothetical protein
MPAMRIFLGLFLLILAVQAAAHDVYTGLRSPAGRLCCGGDDCEVIEQVSVHRDGSATFLSRRFRTAVRVPNDIITWIAVPGGHAHWCGAAYQADNPNDAFETLFFTFCAFIDPGGT